MIRISLGLLLFVCCSNFAVAVKPSCQVDPQSSASALDKVILHLTKLSDNDADLHTSLSQLNRSFERRVLQDSITDLKNDMRASDIYQAIDKMFKCLVLEADQLWFSNKVYYMDFFRSWLVIAYCTNLLSNTFDWFPYMTLDSYHEICLRQFQALHATAELVSTTKYVDPSSAISTPEAPKPWQQLLISFPLQLLWLDLAQDAMVKFRRAQGLDGDGTVKEILEMALRLKNGMPKAIPRDQLYSLSNDQQKEYQSLINDDMCPICYEKMGFKPGERLHCEYFCGNAFHTKCIQDYNLRGERKGSSAICPYRCRWPVIEVPRKQGLGQWLKMAYQFTKGLVEHFAQTE